MTDRQQEDDSHVIRISHEEMTAEFTRILLAHGFTPEKAASCAAVFTANSVDGVYTHGVNRFPRFVDYVRQGYVLTDAEPSVTHRFGALEQWDGHLGPGPLNAIRATDRVMELARTSGLACVALANTNHWMRGGFYGWRAAKAGFVFLGWTNTIANMPAWQASDSRLGNNPLVIAIPHQDEAIVLDMAMSQYSFGAIELHKMRKQQLAVPGGYDLQGEMTKDPAEIMQSKKALPIGYWKGAGLSLLLDLLATLLSGGNSTSLITQGGTEYSVSQVFIAIDTSALGNRPFVQTAIDQVIEDYHASVPLPAGDSVKYPGERVLQTRQENLREGVPVQKSVWRQILDL